MKVQVFDMRDAKEARDRWLVLRVVNDQGHAVSNGPWFGSEQELRDHVSILEFGYAVTAQWVGPAPVVSEQGTGSGERLSERSSEAETDCALRWCPHCNIPTQQERLSDRSWMCCTCGKVLVESRGEPAEPPVLKRRPARPKQDGLNQLALF